CVAAQGKAAVPAGGDGDQCAVAVGVLGQGARAGGAGPGRGPARSVHKGRKRGQAVIGLLHPGQMGAAVGAQLVGAGHSVLWCRSGRSEASTRRAEAAGLRAVDTLSELLAASEVVLSICPPAAASNLAAEGAGFDGIY